jgi:hypothetical protein
LLQVPAALCNIHGTQQQVLHCERRWPFLHHTTTSHQLLHSSCWAIYINHSSDHWIFLFRSFVLWGCQRTLEFKLAGTKKIKIYVYILKHQNWHCNANIMIKKP